MYALSTKSTREMPYTTRRYDLWECLNHHTIGPLPKDKYGYKHILNIIDMFSGFQHLVATKNLDAGSALRALIHHVGLLGVHNDIQSDQGKQFIFEAVTRAVL